MGHTPYGYRIHNGIAVVDEKEADKIRKLYQGYLAGLSLSMAAKEADINVYHGTAGKMLRNKRYMGDDYYPRIIDNESFEKAEDERGKRAKKLGRVFEPKEKKTVEVPMKFVVGDIKQEYINPFKQAEYAYSLIESEVINSDS